MITFFSFRIDPPWAAGPTRWLLPSWEQWRWITSTKTGKMRMWPENKKINKRKQWKSKWKHEIEKSSWNSIEKWKWTNENEKSTWKLKWKNTMNRRKKGWNERSFGNVPSKKTVGKEEKTMKQIKKKKKVQARVGSYNCRLLRAHSLKWSSGRLFSKNTSLIWSGLSLRLSNRHSLVAHFNT